MAKTIYNVTKVKVSPKDPEKKFYTRIGKVIIHDGGKTGVLFLDMFDGLCGSRHKPSYVDLPVMRTPGWAVRRLPPAPWRHVSIIGALPYP